MSEYYVARSYASTEPLIEPDNYVNTRTQFLLRAIRNNESIAKNILAAKFAGINAASEKYYECGTDGNCYPFFPPHIKYVEIATQEEVLIWAKQQTELPESEADRLVFNNYYYGPINYKFYAEYYLFTERWTDLLGKSWHPYLSTIAIPYYGTNYPVPPYMEVPNELEIQWLPGNLPSVVVDTGYVDPETQAKVYHTLTEIPWVLPSSIFYMFTLEYPPPGDCRDTSFPCTNLKNETDYVYYGLLSQAEAINLFNLTVTDEIYMPLVCIMRDEHYYDHFGLGEQTEKILKHLNLDPVEIAQACRDVEIQNPDIKKTDFFISYGLEANLTSGYVIEKANVDNAHWQYLYEFFKFWSENGALDRETWEAMINSSPQNQYEAQSSIDLVCWDSLFFLMVLRCSYIEPIFSEEYPLGRVTAGTIWKKLEDGSYAGYYIKDLNAAYHINVSRGFRAAIQDPPLVPISWRLLNNLESPSKERILQMSLRATLFLIEERIEDVPWYKETIFSVIFTAVILVVIVIFQQYELIPILATALGLSVYTTTVIINIILGYLLAFAMQGLSQDLQMIIAVVVIIYTLGSSTNWNFTDLWKGFTKETFASVTKLLESVSDIYSFVKQYSFQDEYQQMMWEYEREAQSYREQQQELEDAYYDLANPSNINPWDLIQSPGSYVAENSEEFLARTRWRNAGTESFAMMENFFKMALTLPKKLGQGNPLMLINGFSELA